MEIKRYFALIWHWAWLVVLGTAVAGGTTYLISKNTVPVYYASSRLLIDEAPGSNGNDYSQLLLNQRMALTYIEILQTEPVLQGTIDRLELKEDVADLAGKISVSAPEDTQIIIIGVEDTDRDRAALIANTLGQVFIDQNQARASLRYAEPIANWQKRLDEMGDEIERLQTQINALDTPETAEDQAAYSRLETQLNGAQIRYTEAFNNLNELQVEQAKGSSNIIQIEPAQPGRKPIRPRTTINTLLAAILGSLVTVGIIFLVEYLDDSITSPDQIVEDTTLSTIGTIAQIKGGSSADRLITHTAPRDPISEAYRVLRTNLSFSAVDGGLSSILVTSSSPGEGKSTTAANLAVVMAQTGKQVILVDADLRRPVQHTVFDTTNNQGLTTAVLDKETSIEQYIQKTKISNLRLMPSGPIPPNPAELLNSQRMAEVLESLTDISDLVIFDTPPALTVADATILAPQMSGTILVAEVGKTKRTILVQAVERLFKAKAIVFGVVLNRLSPSRGGYYHNYYYQYYNAYQYNQKKRTSILQRSVPAWLSGLIKR